MKFNLFKAPRSLIAMISGKNNNKKAPQKVEQHRERTSTVPAQEEKKLPSKFSNIGLPKEVLTAIEKMGYDDMTPVQEATYPIIMSGQDLCAWRKRDRERLPPVRFPLFSR